MNRFSISIAFLVLSTAAQAYSGEQYVTCNLNPKGDNWVALRAAPDSNSRRVMKLGPATFLITYEPTARGKWREVTVQKDMQDWSHSGPNGWVHTDYICEVRHRN